MSNFLLLAHRLKFEENTWIGSRPDVLRRGDGGGFQIAKRTILLEQTVLLTANLSDSF